MTYKKIHNEKIGEEYFTANIGGLDVIVIPKRDFSTKHAVFASKFGSVNRSFTFDNKHYVLPDGTAHFLEHKMFSKPYGDAFEKFSATGANANAYTSYNHTGYLFSCANDFEDSLRILIETVTTPYFTEETVSKEFGIIKQEIDMLHDNPTNRCYYDLLDCLFFDHPIKYEIAGTESTISRITPDILYLAHKAFYTPRNTVLCCCGDINEDSVADIVSEYFTGQNDNCAIPDGYPETEKVFKPSKREKMSVSIPIFSFGIKDAPVKYEGRELIKHSLACEIIADTLSSRSGEFFLKMYNKGLINGSFDSDVMREKEFGVFSFSGESENPEKIIDAVKEELYALKRRGVSQREFLRAKNNNYGCFLSSFDSCENLAYEYLYAHFDGVTPFDTMDIYNSLTLDYINSKLDCFNVENSAYSIIDKED